MTETKTAKELTARYFRWTNEFMASLWIKVSQRWINYTGKMLYMSLAHSVSVSMCCWWNSLGISPCFSCFTFFFSTLHNSPNPCYSIFTSFSLLLPPNERKNQQNRMWHSISNYPLGAFAIDTMMAMDNTTMNKWKRKLNLALIIHWNVIHHCLLHEKLCLYCCTTWCRCAHIN